MPEYYGHAGSGRSPVLDADPEEDQRLQAETLRAAEVVANGGTVGSVEVVVANLLAMYYDGAPAPSRPAACEDVIEQAARAIAEADELNFSSRPGVVFDNAGEWYQRHCRGLAHALAARGLLADGTDRRRIEAIRAVLDSEWSDIVAWEDDADRRLREIAALTADTPEADRGE